MKRKALMAQFKGGRLFPRVEFHEFDRERAALLRDAEADAEPGEKPVEIVNVWITERNER